MPTKADFQVIHGSFVFEIPKGLMTPDLRVAKDKCDRKDANTLFRSMILLDTDPYA